MSRSQYIPTPPRWRLLIPNFSSTMSTIPICTLLLLTSAGLMMSESQQLVLVGSVLAGSVIGSVFQVTRALITKSEAEVPRQVIIYRFASHCAGGCLFGVLGCLAAIYWMKWEVPLVLLGFSSGGLFGWTSEAVAKQFEPKILDMLERTGRLPSKDIPSASKEINLTPPTVNLSPSSEKEL